MSDIAVNEKGIVNANKVNVREDAGLKYARLYYAQKGDIVKILARKTGTDDNLWYQVENENRYSSKHGWILNEFVDPYTSQGGEGGGESSSWIVCWTNTPPDETVNVRMGPGTNYSIKKRLPHGTKVEAYKYDSTWSQVRLYNTTAVIGYVMTKFLIGYDPIGGSGNTDVETGILTAGVIKHTDWVNIRSTPSTSDTNIIGRLFPGDPLMFYANETHTGSGYDWYRVQFDGDAYIQQKYVVADTNDRTIVESYQYNADAAVAYAENHTEDTADKMAVCSNYNKSFGFNTNDCANFVNQCLCAGGLPMFDGWSKNIQGIPSEWSDSKNWNLTNASRCPLIAKGRIKFIHPYEVKKGDIIYTYDDEQTDHFKYPHVVIASSNYSEGKCQVHGHTWNQKSKDKALDDTTCRCYRVMGTIYRERCEKKVVLPETGDGATAVES